MPKIRINNTKAEWRNQEGDSGLALRRNSTKLAECVLDEYNRWSARLYTDAELSEYIVLSSSTMRGDSFADLKAAQRICELITQVDAYHAASK